MKKFTSMIALAAVAGSAVAATPMASNVATSSEAQLSQVKNVAVVSQMQKAPAMKAVAMDDVLGPYSMAYTWGLTGQDRWAGRLSPMLVKGDTDSEVIIKNMPYSDVDVVAQVDLNAGTFTISKQDALYMDNYQEMSVWQPKQITENGVTDMNSLVGKITADGIEFPVNTAIAMQISQGYFVMFCDMTWTKLFYFDFEGGNYRKAGDTEMTDYVVNAAFKEEYRVGTQKVETYVNGAGTEFVIYNPYQTAAWQEMNVAFAIENVKPGYLCLNVANPDVAWLRPLTPSGFWMNDGTADAPVLEEWYIYNSEGRSVFFDGYTTEEVYDEFAAIMDTPSSYDPTTRKANIINCFFGLTSEPTNAYYFNSGTQEEPVNELNYQLTLPALSGVEGVEVAEEGAVKYFNMQGMEVVNPAKGQLVIKKQGNKAVKVVM